MICVNKVHGTLMSAISPVVHSLNLRGVSFLHKLRWPLTLMEEHRLRMLDFSLSQQ